MLPQGWCCRSNRCRARWEYPDEQQEAIILDNVENGFDSADLTTAHIEKVIDNTILLQLRATVRRLYKRDFEKFSYE